LIEDRKLPPALQLFPHPELRSYQTKFLRFVEKYPKAMVHAPVGFGKTIMALISTLPLVRQKNYQLFIFVRTKAQIFRVFLNEIYKIANSRKYGYLTAVPLILKGDLCIKRNEIPIFYRGICSAIRCRYLEQTRSIPEEDFPAIVEQIPITAHDGSVTIETFKEAFREFGCPYHCIKRSIPYSNIVVTTQTYLRSKNLQNMFSQLISRSLFSHHIAIIDEAHNFTADIEAELTIRDLNKAQTTIPLKIIDELRDLIMSYKGRVERPSSLSAAALDAFLDHEIKLSFSEKIYLLKIKDFLASRGDIWVSEEEKLVQLNPFPDQSFTFVNDLFDRVILMSGTFTPVKSYKILYGLSDYASLQIPSDFQFSLNGILYQRQFTSKFNERNSRTYQDMATVIQRLHQSNPFHTIVYTPSHELKEKILAHISLSNVYIENPDCPPIFIDELKQKRHECIFGVIGGKLSEGIEILDSNNRSLLSLLIIAGIPFPRPDNTNQLLRSLYSQKWGWWMSKHLSMLPVVRNISQAIGRGIRSESDFAASLILDYRAVKMRNMLPSVRVFRRMQDLYNTYDIFYAKMNRLFRLR
jgi:DNA excision repair protein ERCC-2